MIIQECEHLWSRIAFSPVQMDLKIHDASFRDKFASQRIMEVMTDDKKNKLSLTVNGEERILMADPASSLLDAIRDDMRESSVQLRCGEGRCGGCVVLLDGKRVLACDIPISQADGRAVTII